MIPCDLLNFTYGFLNNHVQLRRVFFDYVNSVKIVREKKLRLRFLDNCLINKVCPKSILPERLSSFDGVPFSRAADEVIRQKIRVVKVEIDRNYFMVRKNFDNFRKMFEIGDFPTMYLSNLLDFCFAYVKDKISTTEYELNRKFEKVFEQSVWRKFSNSELILNLSSFELKYYEQIVLGFGLSFGFTEGSDLYERFLHNYQKFLKYTNLDCFKDENFSFAVKGFILNEISHCCNNDSAPKVLIDALFNLKKVNNVIFSRADKGNKIVILDKDLYLEKAYNLLNNELVYKKLLSNPLKNAQSNYNSKLKLILKNHHDLIKNFTSYLPNLAYFYGLPKIHKSDVPLRPIISNVNTITYKLAKWISNILSPLIGSISSSHVENSSVFVEKVRHVVLSGKRMLSFDVTSLFTSVPTDVVLVWLREYILKSSFALPVSIDCFFDLLKLSLSFSHFSFNGEFFTQISGLSMGSPLSPILRNIFMEFFERRFLVDILLDGFIWYRYVDDIFAVLPVDLDLEFILQRLNDCVPEIKFTLELEVNGCLPFLDVLLIRNNDRLSFKIFRKPTHTDSYVHWLSCHSKKVKKGILSGFFLRALRLCCPQFLDEELEHIRDTFGKLYYPSAFISSTWTACRKRFYSSTSRNVPSKGSFLSVPVSSEKIETLFKPELNLVSGVGCNIGRFLGGNNCGKIRTDLSAGVYRIPCSDCDKVYIGETCDLKRRVYQHGYALHTGDNDSALQRHRMDFQHNIQISSAALIFNSDSVDRRRLYESFAINNSNNFNLGNSHIIDNFSNKFLLRYSKMSNFLKTLNHVT